MEGLKEKIKASLTVTTQGKTPSLLVKNEACTDVKVYFYSKLNFTGGKICSESMVVKPAQTRLKCTGMKFEVFRDKIKLSEARFLEFDTLCEVTNDGVHFTIIDEESVYKKELQLKEQTIAFEEDNTQNGMKNFYSVLGLDMEEIRAKSYEEQTREIRKAYQQLSLKMHPDKNQDNVLYNREVWNMMLHAYEQLSDEQKRVEYHNNYDFQHSFFSKSFWKSLFWPEVHTNNPDAIPWERIELCMKRIAFFVGSVAMVGGGFALISTTAWPLTILAFSLLTGGMFAGRASLQLDTTIRKYLQTMALGCVAGAATGGVAAGATFGIAGGVGAAALAKVGIGAEIGLGTLTAATTGITTSLANDADRSLNGEEVKLAEALTNAVVNGAVSAPIGVAGAAIAAGTNFHIGKLLADTNLDEAALTIFFRRAALNLYSKGLPVLGEKLAQFAIQSPLSFIQDRLDKSTDDKGLSKHAAENSKAVGKEFLQQLPGALANMHMIKRSPNEEFHGDLKIANVFKQRQMTQKTKCQTIANENPWLDDEDASWLE